MRILSQFFYLSNQLSLLRLVFIPFVILTILYGQYRTAFVLVLIAGLTDGMDGLLARRLRQQTALGGILDPLADKLLLNSAFVALGVAQQLPLWLVILVLSRDVIIITISLVMILTTTHRPFPPSFYSKANTVAQVVTVLFTLFVLVLPNEILAGLRIAGIYSTAGLTVASGLQYASRTAESLRRVEQNSPTSRASGFNEGTLERRQEETITGQKR
ncbi:MAG: CDP-alcohol phosphatidyltransferase family protein [Acidobacteria bacterium]|nr:CDP-alcohol phosphatidyltransferase family protein [Acidobacteriota bacterium]